MSRSRTRRAVAGLAAVATIAGCTALSQDAVEPAEFADPPIVSEQARQMYGDRALAAYEQVTDFLLTHSTPEKFLRPGSPEPVEADLTEGVTDAMTGTAAAAWQIHVAKALADDVQAVDTVNLLRFHDLDTTNSTPPRTGDILAGQSITEGRVDLGDPAAVAADDTAATSAAGDAEEPAAAAAPVPLTISLVHRARIRLEEDRVPYRVSITRPLTLTLTPVDDRWLIANFTGSLQTRTVIGVPPTVVEDSSTTTP